MSSKSRIFHLLPGRDFHPLPGRDVEIVDG
jgi:hypothetical protein